MNICESECTITSSISIAIEHNLGPENVLFEITALDTVFDTILDESHHFNFYPFP